MIKTDNILAPNIKLDDIVKTVIDSVVNCYGVKRIIKNKELKYPDITKKGNVEAVFVKYLFTTYSIDVYLELTLGIKISEALREIQKLLNYELSKKFKFKNFIVNVYAEKLS